MGARRELSSTLGPEDFVSEQQRVVGMYNLPWFNNTRKDPPKKSIECALEHAAYRGHRVVLSLQHPEVGRCYSSVNSQEAFIRLASNTEHLFEVLPECLPRHFYSDLDWAMEEHPDVDVVLGEYLAYVAAFLKDHWDFEISDDVQISTSCGVAKCGSFKNVKKASFHLRFPFGFRNQAEAKCFADRLHEALDTDQPPGLMYYNAKKKCREPVFDNSTFSKNQSWRCLYSSKIEDKTRKLLPYGNSSPLFKDHIVGLYNPDDIDQMTYIPIEVPTSVKSSHNRSNRSNIKFEDQMYDAEFNEEDRVPFELLKVATMALDVKRLTEYTGWRDVMFAIHNISQENGYMDQGRELMHHVSNRADGYANDTTRDVFLGALRYSSTGYHFGSIRRWLREDNEKLYSSIARGKYRHLMCPLSKQVKEQLIPTCFDGFDVQRYGKGAPYEERFVRPFEIKSEQMLGIVSAPGTGKSEQIIRQIASGGLDSVCWPTPRKSLTKGMLRRLNSYLDDYWQEMHGQPCPEKDKFVSYLDSNGNLTEHKRIVIQMESLYRIKGAKYDALIVDESESCYSQFSSFQTMHRHLKGCARVFWDLVRECRFMVAMDAFMTDKTLHSLRCFADERGVRPDLIVNEYRPSGKIAFEINGSTLEESKRMFMDILITKLRAGERVVIFTGHANFGEVVEREVKRTMGANFQMRYYHGRADSDVKNELDDVNTHWAPLQMLMYSPIVLAGLTYTHDAYDTLMMFGYAGSCVVRDAFQAHLRVRKFNNKELYFLLDTSYYQNEPTFVSYQGVKKHIATKAALTDAYYSRSADARSKQAILEDMWRLVTDKSINRDEKQRKMTEIQGEIDGMEPIPNWLLDIHIRNILEENTSKRFMRGVWYAYLKRSGFDDIVQVMPEGELAIVTESKTDPAPVVHTAVKYASIPEIDAREYERIKQAINQDGSATEEEQASASRFRFDNVVVMNKNASEAEKAVVYDAQVAQQKIRALMYNKLCECNSSTASMVDKRIETSPYLEMHPVDAVVLGQMKRMCKILGLKNTHDLGAEVTDAVLDKQYQALKELLRELESTLGGVRGAGTERTGELPPGKVGKLPELKSRISTVLKKWSGTKLCVSKKRNRFVKKVRKVETDYILGVEEPLLEAILKVVAPVRL